MDYWKECIAEAFEDAKIEATDEQIMTVSLWAEGAHDNYSQAHGYDVRRSPVETDKDRIIANLKKQISELEGDVSIFRQSVATRRGVRPEDVELERYGNGRGDVIYRP